MSCFEPMTRNERRRIRRNLARAVEMMAMDGRAAAGMGEDADQFARVIESVMPAFLEFWFCEVNHRIGQCEPHGALWKREVATAESTLINLAALMMGQMACQRLHGVRDEETRVVYVGHLVQGFANALVNQIGAMERGSRYDPRTGAVKHAEGVH